MKSGFALGVIAFICVSLPWMVAAQTLGDEPPRIGPIGRLPATLKNAPSPVILLGKQRIILEQTTLDDIVHAIGQGKIRHRGDAGEAESWVCYEIEKKSEAHLIWLSSGELEGGSIIDNFRSSLVNVQATNPSCPKLGRSFDGVVWNGKSIDKSNGKALIESLGKPSLKKDDWWIYSYEKTRSGNMIVSGIVAVRIVDGKVTDFSMSKDTSN